MIAASVLIFGPKHEGKTCKSASAYVWVEVNVENYVIVLIIIVNVLIMMIIILNGISEVQIKS